MKPLLLDWEELTRRVRRKGGVFLGLDFDGTLAPIALRPSQARMPSHIRQALRALASKPSCRVAVVSGRALGDLRRKVGLRAVAYAGNHGIEVGGAGRSFLHPRASAAARKLREIGVFIERGLRECPGTEIEDKRYSLALHYRNAPTAHIPRVERVAQEALAKLGRGFHLIRGRKVVEVAMRLPSPKGGALRLFIRKWAAFCPLFLGDDRVDEGAFYEVRRAGGMGIFVGPPRTAPRSTWATHYLARQAQVPLFLDKLARLMGDL